MVYLLLLTAMVMAFDLQKKPRPILIIDFFEVLSIFNCNAYSIF
jgi:hypothetical protein